LRVERGENPPKGLRGAERICRRQATTEPPAELKQEIPICSDRVHVADERDVEVEVLDRELVAAIRLEVADDDRLKRRQLTAEPKSSIAERLAAPCRDRRVPRAAPGAALSEPRSELGQARAEDEADEGHNNAGNRVARSGDYRAHVNWTETLPVTMETAIALTPIATATYALLTLLLLLEARASRNTRHEANFSAYPRPHPSSGMYLEVIAENYGPATAADVVGFIRLIDAGGNALPASEQRQAEPVWGPGGTRRFMPRPDADGQILALRDLGERGLSLCLEWQWSDSARWLFDLAQRRKFARHKHVSTYDLRRYSEDIYGGRALVENDPLATLPKINEELGKVRGSSRRSAPSRGRQSGSGSQNYPPSGTRVTAPRPVRLRTPN
jgi:hypothetical protein